MARLPRLFVEGCPQHIIQRGNNRDVCFYRDADYAFYLQKLAKAASEFDVAIHAYVLMTNHVHLLVSPAFKNSVSKMMQCLGRQYVRYINITYGRSGTLWEGRFKSSLVDSQSYFFTLSKYIELNPVRAGMVKHPGEYPWSSYRSNGMGLDIQLLTPHEEYIGLGSNSAQRVLAYRKLFNATVPLTVIDEIRLCANKEWVIGSEKFRAQIVHAEDRRLQRSQWGGDRKSKAFKLD